MRTAILCAMATIMLFTWASTGWAADWPNADWHVNNWRKNNATASWHRVEAPDGSSAIEIAFKGDQGPNVASPSLKAIARQWPKDFGEVSFYLHGDGSGQMLTIQFHTQAGHTYNVHQRLTHTGWQYVTARSLWKRSETPPLDPRAIDMMVISAATTCQTAVGAPHFTPRGVDVTLNVGASGFAVRTETAPTMDGRLDDEVWSRCPVMTADHSLKTGGELAAGKCRFRVAFDDQSLYVAAQIQRNVDDLQHSPRMERRDSSLWLDEAIELFVNPTQDLETHYQFLCNNIGTQGDYARHFDQDADAIVQDSQWNGQWTSATAQSENGWSVEVAIPWKTIRVDAPQNMINFQLMYDHWKSSPSQHHAVWSPAEGKPMNTWGVFRLENAPTADRASLTLNNVGLKRISPGQWWLTARINKTDATSNPVLGPMHLTAQLAGPDGQSVTWQRDMTGKESQTAFESELRYDGPANGPHRLVVSVESDDDLSLLPATLLADFTQELPVDVDYGDRILHPRPKQVTWGKGTFTLQAGDLIAIASNATERTRKTAEYLSKKLENHFGVRAAVVTEGTNRIRLSVDPGRVGQGIDAVSVDGAYLLHVTDQSIDLIGADEAGLYYAVVTLNQLARVAHEPRAPIQAVSISDWPSSSQRVYVEWVTKISQPSDIPILKEHLKNVVAGSKYNVFVFTVDDSFVYKKHPKLTRYPLLTAEKYREIADFAREHFLEVVPGTLFGGHSRWVTRAYPNLQEKGYDASQIDVTRAEVYPLMRDIYSELIDASGPQTQRFFIWHDEWWHRPQGSQAVEHHGLTRQQIFFNDLTQNYQFLKSRGLDMMMWTDMIDPNHNGGPPFHLSKIASDLPRDIIMCSWSNSPQWLHEMGFSTMQINNHFSVPSPSLAKYIQGHGTIAYLLQHSLFSYVPDDKAANYSWHATLRAAEYGWNMDRDSNLSRAQWARQFMPNLMATYGGEPSNPQAGREVTPIVMKSDSALARKLGLNGKRSVGKIPMELFAVLVGDQGVKVDLPEPQKVSSVILLHGVLFPDEQAREKTHKQVLDQRVFYDGVLVGTLRLLYADGSDAQTELHLGRNTIDMSGGRLNRYVRGGRDILELNNGQALVQTEWVNPHPDRLVQAMQLICPDPLAPMLWAGLSLRSVE